MNNVGKPALYGLTHPTIGTFFMGNHLSLGWAKLEKILTYLKNNVSFAHPTKVQNLPDPILAHH
jgi:hypothetical protein